MADPLALVDDRTCGSCTACCEHIANDEPAIAHAAHVACHHLVDGKCDTYASRPASCRTFRCAWLEGAGNAAMRPDRCGVLIFFGSKPGVPVFISATETRAGALDEGTEARRALEEEGFRLPVILDYFDGRRQAIIPASLQAAIDGEAKRS